MCGIWRPDLWEFWKTMLIVSLHGVPPPHPHPLPRCYAGSDGGQRVSFSFQALLAGRAGTFGESGRLIVASVSLQIEWSPGGLGSREEVKTSWDPTVPAARGWRLPTPPPFQG